MLTQNYIFYLEKIMLAALGSLPGMAAVLLVLFAIGSIFFLKADSTLRGPVFWLGLIIGIALLVFAARSSVYRFNEQPDTIFIEELQGTPTCDTHWSGWIRSGYGMGNPCPRGCFRGKIVNKEMRLRGFPPWPEFRREMQCWAR